MMGDTPNNKDIALFGKRAISGRLVVSFWRIPWPDPAFKAPDIVGESLEFTIPT
jgi:hypothetical protein